MRLTSHLIRTGPKAGVTVLGCVILVLGSLHEPAAHAQDAANVAVRVTATEPAALVSGSNVTLKLRGFELKQVTALRFPAAEQVAVKILETKDADQPKGLDNKQVGTTQIVAEFALPGDIPSGMLEYVLVTPSGEISGEIRVIATDAAVDEKEPNDGFRDAQELLSGQSARGAIQSDRDVDVFAFPVEAGLQFKVHVSSGGPLLADLALHCYDSQGQLVAAADDDQTRDPAMTLQAKSSGNLFLCISSAHDIGGPWHSYLLTVEEVK